MRGLSIFIGALFIFQGASTAFFRGFDRSAQRTNVITGLLSIGAGVAIMVWPSPGLTAVAIFLGSWLIVMGTVTIAGAFAGRDFIPDWWLWLILGLMEVPLGVLAPANPGATLAALITVAGIWAVAVGVTVVVLAFNLKRLPDVVAPVPDRQGDGRHTGEVRPDARRPATSAQS